MAVKSSAAVLLHIGLVNRRSVRFFAPPLEGLDMPWSALGDLARAVERLDWWREQMAA